ncbi:hypothetical protein [Paraburkholderia sediminicola]|uniref:hypothetical protein n=1 Tax=Paraburkholderia sediminicola TaxID=458836 RepID=UPI0038B75E34
MNSHRLRFMKAYLMGYYLDYAELSKVPGFGGLNEGRDTPALEIGKCSPLQ